MASMEEFRGDYEQFERLRERLRVLHETGRAKSAELERLSKEEARRLGTAYMTRTDIDKFREGTVTRPRDLKKVLPLWNVVFSDNFLLPAAPAVSDRASDHPFFDSVVQFFDVHQHRQTRAKKNLLGRFMFYHFSEYFHKFSASVPRAVVVGQWDISLVDGAFCIEEKQNYDGKIGKQMMHEVYNGYCLPKGRNICFILRESHKETPKFYMLEAEFDDPVTLETMVLSGHMLKGSHTRKYFHSPVYAVRVPADKDFERNILRCENIEPNVMHELDALGKRHSYCS
jgi:hypothetical protein